MAQPDYRAPDWDRLFEVASAQDGLFTTQQAADAGYSPQLLAHHMRSGRVLRARRGVYRIVHYPAGAHEDLTIAWLWSEREGVFSHATALALHDLSDLLPARVHMTLPSAWQKRRLRVPEGVQLHFADISEKDREWFDAVPLTNPRRTLADCIDANLSPELIRGAALDALDRGLLTRRQLNFAARALEEFGGL